MTPKEGELDPTMLAEPDTLASEDPALTHGKVPYDVGEVLGRGGMGEVLLARDRKIGRQVALKRMRSAEPSAEAIARFQREAVIQARLDHPAIVPVHELGEDSEGRPYFTMKKLAGTTLAELLETGAVTQKAMLRALVDVCLAIELAHERRVVHRDIKPANIMLGDYGEVYVLDWGIARILDDSREFERVSGDITTLEIGTQAGKLLGTPGYMSPEQAIGEPVGPAADVYALGAVLFEVLAGEPLHARKKAALFETLVGDALSPAARAPDRGVPPELDDACRRALVADPAARPSARSLSDRIQRYLDGDRDLELRRTQSDEQLAAAREALAVGDRAAAVRHAGTAIALDSRSREAAALFTRIIVEPPQTLPPELARAVESNELERMRERSRRALAPFLSFFALTPFLPALHVQSWPTLVGVYAALLLVAGASFVSWKYRLPIWALLAAQLVFAVMFSRIGSPFILTPTLIAGMLLGSTAVPSFGERPWAVFAWAVTATLLPFALEWLGAFGQTWWFERGRGLVTTGTVFENLHDANIVGVVVANVAIVALVAQYARTIARDRRAAEVRTFVQAWHLQQLVPRDAEPTAG